MDPAAIDGGVFSLSSLSEIHLLDISLIISISFGSISQNVSQNLSIKSSAFMDFASVIRLLLLLLNCNIS